MKIIQDNGGLFHHLFQKEMKINVYIDIDDFVKEEWIILRTGLKKKMILFRNLSKELVKIGN